MKKILLLLLLIVVSVIVLPPFFLGKQVEPRLQRFTDWYNSYPGNRATIEAFEQGWFSSKAHIRLSHVIWDKLPELFAHQADLSEADQQFFVEMIQGTKSLEAINLSIDHGPFFWDTFGFGAARIKPTIDSDIVESLRHKFEQRFQDELADFHNKANFTLTPVEALSLQPFIIDVGFDGVYRSHFRHPSMTLSVNKIDDPKSAMSFTIGEINIQINFNAHTQQLNYNVDLAKTHGNLIEDEVSKPISGLGGINIGGNWQFLEDMTYLGLGEMHWHFKGYKLPAPGLLSDEAEGVVIEDIIFRLFSNQDESGNIDLGYSFDINGLNLMSIDSDFPIKDVAYGVALKGMSPEMFQSIDELYRKLAVELFRQIEREPGVGEKYFSEAATMGIGYEGIKLGLLAQQQLFYLNAYVDLGIQDGEYIRGSVTLGLKTPFEYRALMDDTDRLMRLFYANAKADLSNNAILNIVLWDTARELKHVREQGLITTEEMNQQLDDIAIEYETVLANLISEGRLVKTDVGYTINGQIQDESVLLNGKVILNLSELIQNNMSDFKYDFYKE